MYSIKGLYTKYRNLPVIIQITTILIASYYIYAASLNPVMGFVFSGLAYGVTAVYEIIIWFIQYFIVILLLFTLLTFTIKTKAVRNTIWFILGIGISVLGTLGFFGEFSWNPINFIDSLDYISFEIKIMFFYYVVILTMLPRSSWMQFSFIFIGMLAVAATGISIVPLVGGFISTIIEMFAKFCLVVFFILNAAAYLLVTIEERIDIMMKRNNDETVLIPQDVL